MTFSASMFALICSSIFDGKCLPKSTQITKMRRAFWHPFRVPFRRSTFGCILVALWLTFGCILAPLGCILAHFGSLLAHFWCALAHFWRPWHYFCSPWRSIFSLLRCPGVIFDISWNFRWKSYVKSDLLKIPIEIQLVFPAFETLSKMNFTRFQNEIR